MSAVAIIVAGGYGKRMGTEQAKQYLLINGAPILVHTARAFERASYIGRTILVVPEDDIAYVDHAIVRKFELKKVVHIVGGGRQRQDSVNNGLSRTDDNDEIVVIHDGVRPLVTEELIDAAVAHASEHGAVTLGVPAKDTVKEVDADGVIRKTLDRDTLWLTQTPQAFQKKIIRRAYKRAYEENYYATDDASLVERMNVHVAMITGSYDNIKITTPEDLEMFELLLQRRSTVP